MRRMLEELYYGNINPNEQIFIKDSQYGKAMKIISGNEEKLTGLLEGKGLDLFLDFVNAQSEVNGITAVENFINGFRIGALMMLDILSEQDGCLRDIT